MRVRDTALFVDANLVYLWEFDGNSNTAVGSNNGTDTDMTYSTAGGKYVQGAVFNGTSSRIQIEKNGFDIASNGSFSVGGWVKGDNSSSGNKNILTIDNGDTRGLILIRFNFGGSDKHLAAVIRDDTDASTQNLESTSDVNDGGWHHIALVKSTNNIKLYVDGVAQVNTTCTENGAYTFSAGNGFFGAETAASNFLPGNEDDWFYFNDALTQAEINLLAFDPLKNSYAYFM